jgi:hypothetical protein
MTSISVLQYGAIGIGLAVLAYTATMLKLELARTKPRPEGRNLILTYMAFSIIAFGIATYIEIKKQNAPFESIVSSLDANLGAKFQSVVRNAPASIKDDLIYYENRLCLDVKALKKVLYDNEETQCKLSSR